MRAPSSKPDSCKFLELWYCFPEMQTDEAMLSKERQTKQSVNNTPLRLA